MSVTGFNVENITSYHAWTFIQNNILIPHSVITRVANIINIIVFTTPSFTKITAGFYLTCLAISDMLQSLNILYWYPPLNPSVFSNICNIDIICRFYCTGYLLSTIQYFSSWNCNHFC